MPFLIFTSFADQEPIMSRIKNKAKLAPINGTYTGPLWARYKDITDGQKNNQRSTLLVFKKVYLTNKSGVQNPL